MTVGRLMTLVAIVAILIGAKRIADRRLQCRAKAASFTAMALQHDVLAKRARRVAANMPTLADQYQADAKRSDDEAARFRRLGAAWRDAADHPWRALPTSDNR